MIWDSLAVLREERLYDELLKFFSPIVRDRIVRAQVSGLEHIPASGPALVIANHRTLTDPVLIAQHLPRRVRVVAAGFFGLMPMVGPMLRASGQIVLPVAGGSRSAALMREAGRHLRAGRVVVIFPEGVDNFVNGTPEGTISPFHTTFARMLLDLAIPDLPVIPIGIQGQEERAFVKFPSVVMRAIDPGNTAWVDGTVRGNLHCGEAQLAIGAPMRFDADYEASGDAREAAVRRITGAVEATIRNLAATPAAAPAREDFAVAG